MNPKHKREFKNRQDIGNRTYIAIYVLYETIFLSPVFMVHIIVFALFLLIVQSYIIDLEILVDIKYMHMYRTIIIMTTNIYL